MTPNKRQEFLKKTALVAIASLLSPKLLLAANPAGKFRPGSRAGLSALPPFQLKDAVIDLHCHPSLKPYLLNKKLMSPYHLWPGDNLFRMQEGFRQFSTGHVRGGRRQVTRN